MAAVPGRALASTETGGPTGRRTTRSLVDQDARVPRAVRSERFRAHLVLIDVP